MYIRHEQQEHHLWHDAIRDPDMISITSAPEAPAPRIRILDARQKEVETVRIGDRLTFKIEIPDKTPYGIFAR